MIPHRAASTIYFSCEMNKAKGSIPMTTKTGNRNLQACFAVRKSLTLATEIAV